MFLDRFARPGDVDTLRTKKRTLPDVISWLTKNSTHFTLTLQVSGSLPGILTVMGKLFSREP